MGESEDQLLAVQRIVTFAAQQLDSVAPFIEQVMQPAIEASRQIERTIAGYGDGVVRYHGLDMAPEQFEAKLVEELGLVAFDNARRRVIAALSDPMDDLAR